MFGEMQDVFFTFEKREPEKYCQFCKSAMLDLAILSLCNHSIITYGTFSFWSSYLKSTSVNEKSITILPSGYSVFPHPILTPAKYIHTWKKMNDPCYIRNRYHAVTLSPRCIQNFKSYGIRKEDFERMEKQNSKITSIDGI